MKQSPYLEVDSGLS